MSIFTFGFLVGVVVGIFAWEKYQRPDVVQNHIEKVKNSDGNLFSQTQEKTPRKKKGFLWGLFRKKIHHEKRA